MKMMNLKKVLNSQKYPRTMTVRVMKIWAQMRNLAKIGVIWNVKQLKKIGNERMVDLNLHPPSTRA